MIDVPAELLVFGDCSARYPWGFRHFGNVVGGTVITTMLYTALSGASAAFAQFAGFQRSCGLCGPDGGRCGSDLRGASGKEAGVENSGHCSDGDCQSLLCCSRWVWWSGVPILGLGLLRHFVPCILDIFFLALSRHLFSAC
ncbi:MAG: hypothetical protein ACLU9S_08485 [Oscillospiraceae bacterium]